MMKYLSFAAVATLAATLVAAPTAAKTMSSAMMPTCAAGDKVVWVSRHHRVFYESGMAMYGKTKRGTYMCESDAMAKHMHLAKAGSIRGQSMMNGRGMHGMGSTSGDMPSGGRVTPAPIVTASPSG